MDGVLHDMHVHLGFMSNAGEVAADARAAGCLMFANTVTPDEWLALSPRFESFANVRVGFGMHPWWVGGMRGGRLFASDDVVGLLDAHDPRFIGEIGLDFGKRHNQTRDDQLAVFRGIIGWMAGRGGKLASLHSVHAAADVLDVLEASGALESCTFVFHWFTGPSDQLKRAIEDGCYFSVGPRMLASGKGREYVKAIPVKRLLLETDAPPEQGTAYSFSELSAELAAAADAVRAIKGADALGEIDRTTRLLLGR